MKKEYRIKKSKEIDAIINKKQRYGDMFFVIYYKENKANHFRLAISIGKKYGNSVERNKIKRQIRSIFRDTSPLESVDYIVVVKKEAKTLIFKEIEESLLKQLKKIKEESNK